jgi:hypothetical protein
MYARLVVANAGWLAVASLPDRLLRGMFIKRYCYGGGSRVHPAAVDPRSSHCFGGDEHDFESAADRCAFEALVRTRPVLVEGFRRK